MFLPSPRLVSKPGDGPLFETRLMTPGDAVEGVLEPSLSISLIERSAEKSNSSTGRTKSEPKSMKSVNPLFVMNPTLSDPSIVFSGIFHSNELVTFPARSNVSSSTSAKLSAKVSEEFDVATLNSDSKFLMIISVNSQRYSSTRSPSTSEKLLSVAPVSCCPAANVAANRPGAMNSLSIVNSMSLATGSPFS